MNINLYSYNIWLIFDTKQCQDPLLEEYNIKF